MKILNDEVKAFIGKYWLIFIILFAAGFLLGQCNKKSIVKVEYIKGETKIDTIYSEKLVPYKVIVPAKPILITKVDTIKIPGVLEYTTTVVDTAAIIADYIKENFYKTLLFDSKTDGKLTVSTQIQYNKLKKLSYEFTPIYKQTTITRNQIFMPFGTASYNTLGYFGIGGGTYYKHIGVSVKYLTDFSTKGYEFGVYYKF